MEKVKPWIIVDENTNYVASFYTYKEAVDDAIQAARETAEKFSVTQLIAVVNPEMWVKVDILECPLEG